MLLDPIGGGSAIQPNQPLNSRPDLGQIERDYQVETDKMIKWEPNYVGWFVKSTKMTKTEGEMLDNLQSKEGLIGVDEFKKIGKEAFSTSEKRFDTESAEDGHQDAFRHAYWNARMTKEYGEKFAKDFATAHEGTSNKSDREAMDLYNNEVGRRIATENPHASNKELADLVQAAVGNGEMIVIDRQGNLAWSDQVPVGDHGKANGQFMEEGKPRPDGETYPS